MFWHVYFFSPPVRHAVLFGHVLACLFLQLHLSGMCCSLDMFWHVYFSSRTCQACTAFDSVFTFVLPGRTDATLKQFERHKLEKKKESGTWSLEWLHCKLLVSSFNLKCQYMSVYAMVGITRSKVIFLFFNILGIIIPTDFHIFQRGRFKPPTR